MEPFARHFTIFSALSLLLISTSGCQTLKLNSVADRMAPSNFRNWSPEFTEVAQMQRNGSQIKIRNIRNNEYISEKDFVVNHYDRQFDLDEIRSVDFIVVPFNDAPLLAHTMLSFGLEDQTQIVVSVEIRTEKGEEYSPVLGISRQYELAYVVADERDVIRLRTHHRDAKVYVYPTNATPRQSQQLFVDMMNRANKLAREPEFYDTLTNNCTTNIVRHINQMGFRVPFNLQVLFPGNSDKYAYRLGLLDQSIPFEQLKQRCLINELADRNYSADNFSQLIRQQSHSRRLLR